MLVSCHSPGLAQVHSPTQFPAFMFPTPEKISKGEEEILAVKPRVCESRHFAWIHVGCTVALVYYIKEYVGIMSLSRPCTYPLTIKTQCIHVSHVRRKKKLRKRNQSRKYGKFDACRGFMLAHSRAITLYYEYVDIMSFSMSRTCPLTTTPVFIFSMLNGKISVIRKSKM